jgi:hypothetical protein
VRGMERLMVIYLHRKVRFRRSNTPLTHQKQSRTRNKERDL